MNPSETRSYSELVQIRDFYERFDYLAVPSVVGATTFGAERGLNQAFYNSREWRQIRHYVISRDLGCDLGVEGYEIHDKIYIHHMNPIDVDQIKNRDISILDPEFLISTTHRTHNAIHFASRDALAKGPIERRLGDHILW